MPKKQILIVDDELSILKLLNFVLSPIYELVVKNSGVEAISWLEEGNNPDLIISDLSMPYFDGSLFIRNLKISGFYNKTPIILVSGEENLAERVKEMPFEVNYYISKPFNPSELKVAISTIFEKHDTISSN
jgi:CheY-like chemotaxis protein